MPKATGQPKRTFIAYDADIDLVTPRGQITATTSATEIELLAYSQGVYKAVISHDAYTGFAAGTAQWDIAVEVATAQAGPWTSVGTATLSETAANDEVILSGATVEQALADASWIRTTATLTGGAGPLTYEAFISPVGNGG